MGCLCVKRKPEEPKPLPLTITYQPKDPHVPTQPPPPSIRKRVKALFDYEAESEAEISFQVEDILLILSEEDEGWCMAQHQKTEKKGFIPTEYVVEIQDSLEYMNMKGHQGYLWYHGDISRQDAQQLLWDTETGTFLIRDSNKDQGSLVLVIKGEENAKTTNLNYKIEKLNDGGFRIEGSHSFQSVVKLIEYYRNTDDLRIQLKNPVERLKRQERSRNKWEIDRDSISKVLLLGEGNFGEVHKATWMCGNKRRRVAVKTLKPGSMKPEKFLEEANIMKKLNHPKVLRLLAIVVEDEPLMIVTEFLKNGDLKAYLDGEIGQRLGEFEQRNISYQVASGMAYLESKNFSHNDLAARNILIDYDNIAKIADFGLAKMLKHPEDVYMAGDDKKFPLRWSSPETIEFAHFHIKSDVWSFGVTVYEIFTKGKLPYKGVRNASLLHKLKSGFRMPQEPGTPDDIYEIMRLCWNDDPQRRPSFQLLEQHLMRFATYDETTE